MEKLEIQAEAMWDKTNLELEKALPEDIADYEKSNMLKVRNAELIRMFESYHILGKPIKAKVDLAEKMDFAIADSMRVLQQKQRMLMDSVRTELLKLPADARSSLQEKLQRIDTTACTKIMNHD